MEKDSDHRRDLKKLEKESYQLLCMTWVNDDDYFIRSVSDSYDSKVVKINLSCPVLSCPIYELVPSEIDRSTIQSGVKIRDIF